MPPVPVKVTVPVGAGDLVGVSTSAVRETLPGYCTVCGVTDRIVVVLKVATKVVDVDDELA